MEINKSIKSQFNLLRVSDYNNYPAYFNIFGKKFYLKIEKNELHYYYKKKME